MSETSNQSYAQVANMTTCPDYGTRDIFGLPYVLDVSVDEIMVPSPRHAELQHGVVPTCPTGADATYCACECAAGYALGKCPLPG